MRKPRTPTSRGPVALGAAISARALTAVSGAAVAVPDPDRLVHLQFRRFAGCPVCNLHLRSIVRRHQEIDAAGIREVVIFHSPAEELRVHAADLPFAVVADPDKRLYAEFGVESAPRALLNPRAWGPIARAVARSAWAILRGRERGPASRPHGGRTGLPADFLIAPDGRVLAAKYGEHAYDQWSVDELLKLASDASRAGARPGERSLDTSPEGVS
jgi:peroxiredoxin